jgi:DNA-binding transcriptional MerR regulator
MSERIITLFGEEIVPEQPAVVAKPRTRKKKDDQKADGDEERPDDAAADTMTDDEVAEAPVAEKKAEPAEEFVLPEEWTGTKQYYSIGEVAEIFKVKTSHIRFWTNEFKIKVRTTKKGDRLFTEAQIRELRAIYHLVKERGFTLAGAKARLKAQNKRDVETIDLKSAMLQLRSKLVIIRNQL